MWCHVGRQAAEVARWWSLHEGLHVATQVPAQLVGSAAACERQRRLGWRGPGSGLAGALGNGLAGSRSALASPARILPAGPVGFFGEDGCLLKVQLSLGGFGNS